MDTRESLTPQKPDAAGKKQLRSQNRQYSAMAANWLPRGWVVGFLGNIMMWNIWAKKPTLWIVLLLSIFPYYLVATTPLGLAWQTVFGLSSMAVAIWLRRYQGHIISLILISLSIFCTSRYIYWRLTDTLGFGVYGVTWTDLTFALILMFAELYAFMVLLLGHFQVIWPLERKPTALPDDMTDWPSVDVYIPTYNEPLSVVRPTVLAASEMDWPSSKMKIYILDDGSRDEFRAFAEEAGVGYLTRPDSTHAKAGNINRALTKTSGDYITIFDCDHVPCRSFLQVTMGAFIEDEKLALVQTPHHFFSPDPFERNLGTFRTVPNEGELFYGLLQDGNDLWNATFFCGSCAILKREALEEVGGVAVETVTEDAHTSLKMHKRGWRSAYINVPQAAGLATDSLAGHVGQRIRWARGMAQIFRVDNPLLAPGLKIGQRLCYANAMLHFFYGAPRIIFLLAPLSYLYFEAHIIQAPALLIAVYALPHLALSTLVNSRLQGPYRHSFWAEVYETVLAYYIFLPTLLAVINPKLGKFNVTEKGGINEESYFDANIARPYTIMLMMNVLGFIIGIGRFFIWNTHEVDTVVLNMIWTLYNIVILGSASCVAWEAKQVRRSVRVIENLPALLRLPNGRTVACHTRDISEGGTAIELPQSLAFEKGQEVHVAILPDDKEVYLPSEVVGNDGHMLRLRFLELNVEQEKQLVYCIFGRANAWLNWSARRMVDQPGTSFYRVIGYGYEGLGRIMKHFFTSIPAFLMNFVKGFFGMRSRTSATAAVALVAVAAAAIMGGSVNAQEVEAKPDQVTKLQQRDAQSVTRTLSFKELGFQKPIRLRGIDGQVAVPLSVRDDEVITRAKLTIHMAHSPALLYDLSHINVLVNGEHSGTVELSDETADGTTRSFNIDPRLFVAHNRITLQLIGHYTLECEDPSHTSLWAIISNRSTLEFTTRPLKLANDLALLPQPFFEERDPRKLELPFVFSSDLTSDELTASGIVASWFGAISSYRGARFPVFLDRLPPTNAVVFVNGSKIPAGLSLGEAADANLAIIPHPGSPSSKLLLVMGNNGAELNAAARALALGHNALSGNRVVISALQEPEARKPYDAPKWLPTDRAVELGELAAASDFTVKGLYPEPIRVNFRMAPDLFTWRHEGIPMNLKYRYIPNVAKTSTLNVNVNDEFVEAISLAKVSTENENPNDIKLPFIESEASVDEKEVLIPDYKLGASNQLQFHYFFERKKEGPCSDLVENFEGAVDEDSTIDLSDFPHYAEMPQLNYFATAGYPFTRLADLSETVVVLPERLGPGEIGTYLIIMGRFGASTGYPGIRVKLARASEISSYSGHDVLVLGGADNQPLLQEWANDMPMSMEGDQPRLKVVGPFQRLRARWEGRDIDKAIDHAGNLLLDSNDGLASMMSFESPLDSNRTVVVLTASSGERMEELADLLQEPGKSDFINNDLVLLNGAELNHYRLGGTYWVGNLPLIDRLYWFFSNQPLIMLLLALFVCILLAIVIYRGLRALAATRK